jgi:HTH-type transcriptional regulator, sugar sensing transcriptional regulator
MKPQLLKSFQELGFTAHEVRAYVALLQHGSQTGYELAKRAQISRPNIYPILERLQKRGIVSARHDGNRLLYGALAASEMISNLSGRFTTQIQTVEAELRRLRPPSSQDVAWNLQGREAVLAKAKDLFRRGASRYLIGLWSDEAKELAESMTAAKIRGAELSVLCIQGCDHDCGGCQGKIFRYPLAVQAKTRWLVISADNREILLAQFSAEEPAVGVHSTLDVLVSVAGHYLRNAIAVSEIFRSGGQELLKLMDAQALDAIKGTGLAMDGRSWLDEMLAAVAASNNIGRN